MVGGVLCENMRDALIVQPSFEVGQPAALPDSLGQAQLKSVIKPVVCGMLPLLSSPQQNILCIAKAVAPCRCLWGIGSI